MKNTNTTEKQPSKYLRKIMNKSKENRKKGLASPICNTISDMKKCYDNQDDTTEKQETIEKFREIGLESAYRLDRLFYSDKTGMQVIEDFIQSAVQKARTEIAEELQKEIHRNRVAVIWGNLDKYWYISEEDIHKILAKYLSPTSEKLLCGCPKPDRFAMCINQEHCKEKVQNKINTGSIDTEDKSKEPK